MKNAMKYGRTALIVLGVALIFFLSYVILSTIIKRSEPTYAPDITGVTADGKTLYSLSDHRGEKGTALLFFNPNEEKSIEILQLLSQIAPEYSVEVLPVSLGEEPIEKQTALLQEKGCTVFPHTLFDFSKEIRTVYNISATPILYFIDKNGIITDAYIANISEKSMRKELKAIA